MNRIVGLSSVGRLGREAAGSASQPSDRSENRCLRGSVSTYGCWMSSGKARSPFGATERKQTATDREDMLDQVGGEPRVISLSADSSRPARVQAAAEPGREVHAGARGVAR